MESRIENGKHALDEWAKVYLAPTAIPRELKPTGSVFRGMKSLEVAKEYAIEVSNFFKKHEVLKPVFVVKGPTSTTKMPFEVVDATCGYTVLYRFIGTN